MPKHTSSHPKPLIPIYRLSFLLLVLVLIYSWFFFCRWELFYQSDLGRHLINGKVLLHTGVVPQVNLYAYTQGSFPVVTHHWLSGLIFYLVSFYFGLPALLLLSSLLFVVILALAVLPHWHRLHWPFVLLLLVLLLPILSLRADTRPEIFSYLLLIVYLLILTRFSRGLSSRWLYLLPFLQILWVNLHIFFAFGLILLVWFTVFSWIKSSPAAKTASKIFLLKITLLSFAASLINPFGLSGLLQPFSILNPVQLQYVAENIDLLSYTQVFSNPALTYYLYFYFACFLLTVIFWPNLTRRRLQSQALLLLIFGVLGLFMIRNTSLFAYAALVILGHWLTLISIPPNVLSFLRPAALLTAIGLVLSGFAFHNHIFSPFKPDFGTIVAPGSLRAGQILQSQSDLGFIFNNYDVGGYLIYYLFPHHRVFIDNRPEAYPEAFFRQVYLQALTDDGYWLQLEKLIGFDTIVFGLQDKSGLIDPFVSRRLESFDWSLWYQDDYILILRRQPKINLPQ